MRELAIKKLEALKEKHSGFDKFGHRWNGAYPLDYLSPRKSRVHISDIIFDSCGDDELLELIEYIGKRSVLRIIN